MLDHHEVERHRVGRHVGRVFDADEGGEPPDDRVGGDFRRAGVHVEDDGHSGGVFERLGSPDVPVEIVEGHSEGVVLHDPVGDGRLPDPRSAGYCWPSASGPRVPARPPIESRRPRGYRR